MITIEEFLKSKGLGGYQQFNEPIKELIGIYVQEALEAAAAQAKHIHAAYDKDFKIDPTSILEAYPLKNIQ
jgi:hypothetical protein